MKSLKSFVLFFVSAAMFSCATTHPGNQGHSTAANSKLPIKISAVNIENNPKDAFQLIEVTIENTSDDWLRIDRSEVIINNPAVSKISVVLDNDLSDWGKAMAAREKMEAHNKSLVQTGLGTAGMIAMGGSRKNSTAAGLGAIAVIGTLGWAVTDVINQSYNYSTQAQKTPDNHLYTPFSVPGRMFQRRWVLLNRPSQTRINNLTIQFETTENEKETYEISL